jgi:putative flippase GtrA
MAPAPTTIHEPQVSQSRGRFSLLNTSNSPDLPAVAHPTRQITLQDASIMLKAYSAIDVREFARFILSGVTATIGNMVAVWLARRLLSFEIALLAGIVTAITISFALSKFFAFRSRSWNRAVGEAARFSIVYATGCTIYWTVAVFIRMFLLAHGVPVEAAEPGGVLVGAGTMMLTSYCGHRFFTYRTYQRAKHLDGTL